jgi:hypothetical protein
MDQAQTVVSRKIFLPALLFTGAVLLFLIANRASYKGYFMDDDLNTLSWAKNGDVPLYLYWLVTPRFHPQNFRPVGGFYYRILGGVFGLTYPPYVAALHLLHFCNVIVLYLILRRLKLAPVASGAGALFFMFNVATLEIYWKPMYVYDLLCATFCLLTILLYIRGNWILGLITFWLAYKSKEMAVMLPLALGCFEFLLGQRSWKRLIPYFVISLTFGLQGVLLNPNKDNDYTLHFTLGTIWTGLRFYSSQLFFIPLLVLVAAFLLRNRTVNFGLSTAAALLFPMLVLPGRQFAVYWYVPLIGIAIVVATLSSPVPRWLLVSFFLFWFPFNYAMLRRERKAILAAADANRSYVAAVAGFAQQHPKIQVVGYHGRPQEMHDWGIEGTVHLLFGNAAHLFEASSQEFEQARAKAPTAVIHWQPDGNVWVQGALGP